MTTAAHLAVAACLSALDQLEAEEVVAVARELGLHYHLVCGRQLDGEGLTANGQACQCDNDE